MLSVLFRANVFFGTGLTSLPCTTTLMLLWIPPFSPNTRRAKKTLCKFWASATRIRISPSPLTKTHHSFHKPFFPQGHTANWTSWQGYQRGSWKGNETHIPIMGKSPLKKINAVRKASTGGFFCPVFHSAKVSMNKTNCLYIVTWSAL